MPWPAKFGRLSDYAVRSMRALSADNILVYTLAPGVRVQYQLHDLSIGPVRAAALGRRTDGGATLDPGQGSGSPPPPLFRNDLSEFAPR